MSFAKQPKAAPPFAADLLYAWYKQVSAKLGLTAPVSNQIEWKRYVGSEVEWAGADKGGLRDVVKANAVALDAVKADLDALTARVNALPAGGSVTVNPFPQASGPPGVGERAGGEPRT